jgi:hypothetical protein
LELSRAQSPSHCYHKFDFGSFTGKKSPHCYRKFDIGSFTGKKSPHCYRKFDFGSFTGKKSLPLLPQIRFWSFHGQKEPLIVTANSIMDPSRSQRASHCYRKFDVGSFTGKKSSSLLPQIRCWILHGQKEPLIVTANSILDPSPSRAKRAPHCYRKFDFGAFTGKKSLSLLPQIRYWSFHGQKELLIVTTNSILVPSRAKRAPSLLPQIRFWCLHGQKEPPMLPQIQGWILHGLQRTL